MNVDELINKNKLLEEENIILKGELYQTKEHLKKYTAPIRNKTYYENNKEEHKKKVKEYQKLINYKSNYVASPEQKKEYTRRAYLKRKEKLKKEIEEKSNNENI
jgi:hypothetical protein